MIKGSTLTYNMLLLSPLLPDIKVLNDLPVFTYFFCLFKCENMHLISLYFLFFVLAVCVGN